jgi:hypothetical protein
MLTHRGKIGRRSLEDYSRGEIYFGGLSSNVESVFLFRCTPQAPLGGVGTRNGKLRAGIVYFSFPRFPKI